MRSPLICLGFAALLSFAARAAAQSANDGPVIGARHVRPNSAFKIWNPAGTVRLLAWDRDSVVMRGRVPKTEQTMFGGNSESMKLGIEGHWNTGAANPAALVIYLPRRGKVSIKTISADIDAVDVSGWFYTVSGSIHLSGRATSIEVESMTGNLDLDVTSPWIRARTGDGHLLLRGRPEDVDAATISGTLDVATTTPLRGQFSSVSGDIHYAGSPASGGIFEFSNHSGGIELALPTSAAGSFALSSVVGAIDNRLSPVKPATAPSRSMRFTLGRGGASVTVRTFKGAIRLRPQ
jgi:hypothetical protein